MIYMRTHTIDFKEFTSGRYKEKRSKNKALYMGVLTATGGYLIIGLPKGALAASNVTNGQGDPFENLYDAVMRLFDGAVVIMLLFSAATWAFGHRSQAIERMIGVGCAYVVGRHAKDIRDFLKTI